MCSAEMGSDRVNGGATVSTSALVHVTVPSSSPSAAIAGRVSRFRPSPSPSMNRITDRLS